MQNQTDNSLNTTNAAKLTQLLIQEQSLATNLLDLMLEEKTLLEQSLADELKAITDKKATCLDQLEFVSKTRAQLLLGVSSQATTPERMKDFISRNTTQEQEKLNQLVDKLEQALVQCRKQNSENGLIISMSQRNVQRNLNIIKGADHDSMTYTQKGETTSIGNNMSGIKA